MEVIQNGNIDVVKQAGDAMSINTPGNPAEILGQATQQAVVNMFATVNNKNTFNCTGGGTMGSVKINSRYVQDENPYVQFSIVNTAAGNKNVIIGSMLGINGMYNRYGKVTSACDSASVADQMGNQILAVQGFNSLVNANPVIVFQVQMISSDATQIAQQWKYGDIAYDANIIEKNINVTASFTRYDQDKQINTFRGVWPIGPQNYLSILSMNNVSMVVTLLVGAKATARDYTKAVI